MMKKFLIVIFFSSVLCSYQINRKDRASLSIAWINITKKVFDDSKTVLIIKLQSDYNSQENIIMGVLKSLTLPVSFSGEKLDTEVVLHKQSGILMLRSVEELKTYFKAQHLPTQITFDGISIYVHCLGAKVKDVESIRSRYFLEYHYFLIEESSCIKLMTFVWYYRSDKCRDQDLVEVNRFSKLNNSWQSSEFTIKKFRNFHGCELVVQIAPQGFVSNQYAILLNKRMKNESNIYLKLCNALSGSLNFKFRDLGPKDLYKPYVIRLSNAGLNTLRKADFISHNVYTRSFLFQDNLLAVPVGEKFNGFEKFLLPFDEHVWTAILMTFAIATTTIIIFKYAKESIRKFVFGRYVKTPLMNVVMIFFGISQLKLPGRNFARFLVMSYILYCLIIRTAWQGKMFEFLQKDMRKPEVQSIQEMIDKNFTFYLDQIFVERFKDSELIQKTKKSIVLWGKTEKLVFDLPQQLFNPTFKGTVLIFHDFLKLQAIATEGKIFKRLLKECLFPEYIAFRYNRNHSLFSVIDEKIQGLLEGGIIEFYNRDYESYMGPKRYARFDEVGPQVLTMEDLDAGFTIWICAIFLAVGAFILEWFVRVKDYFMVKNLLSIYFEVVADENRRSNELLKEKMRIKKIKLQQL